MPTDLATRLSLLGSGGAVAPRRTAPAPIESVIEGCYLPTALGECFVAAARRPLGHAQGAVPLERGLALSTSARRALARLAGGEALAPREALFLDTETTGLSGGTGTYAFLVGLGYFEGDTFVLEQYFMRHPGEEAALLEAVRAVLARFPLWITFNGKGFDVPLLATRFQCVRREPLPSPRQHLDLLAVARRLWRGRLPSCSLGTLERALLGVQRADDVPSWSIPGLYFDYVRRQAVAPLRGVFAHNADDVLSMVALLGLVGRVVDEPSRHAPRLDALALVRLLAQAGCLEAAGGWARAALPALEPVDQSRLRWELAALLRRHGARAEAVALWQELAGRPGPWAAAAFEALAKHYEHHARDYDAARRATEAALAALDVQPHASTAAQRERLERRLGRLFFRSRLLGPPHGTVPSGA